MENKKSVRLSAVDQSIMESYMRMMDGLAEFLGTGFEFVLHSLEDIDESVVKIINGYQTGRKIGAPVTDFALGILNKIKDVKLHGHACYESRNKAGETFRSTTILIYGEEQRLIGFLCINFNLNTPLAQMFPFFEQHNATSIPINENFADDVDSLIETAVEDAKNIVDLDQSILPSLRNKEIVTMLNTKGIFNIKDAVVKVSSLLDISKNTIYMHLRACKDKDSDI